MTLTLQIDQDGDGFILRSELRRYLLATPVSEVPLSDDMVDAMLYHVDYNNDGFINLQEFYGLVRLSLDVTFTSFRFLGCLVMYIYIFFLGFFFLLLFISSFNFLFLFSS